MKHLNAILTLSLGLSLVGCAGLGVKEADNLSDKRKSQMVGCVSQFLGQDVAPMDSLQICSTVYSRWAESEQSRKGFEASSQQK